MRYIILCLFVIFMPFSVFSETESLRMETIIGAGGGGSTGEARFATSEGGVSIGYSEDDVLSVPVNALIVKGQVGIGTVGPVNTLDVAGNAVIGQGYVGSSLPAPVNGLLVEGNVGIGTTLPNGKLDVRDGNVVLSDVDVAQPATDEAGAATYGYFGPYSGTAGGLLGYGFSDTDVTGLTLLGTMGSNDPTDTIPAILLSGRKSNGATNVVALGDAETVFQFRNYTTNLVSILGSGKVGIGTTKPSSLLHLYNGTSADTQIVIEGDNMNSRDAILYLKSNSGNEEGAKIWYDNSVGDTYFDSIWNTSQSSDPAIRFRTKVAGTAINAVTITHGGNVGIGTTAPGGKLIIKGAGTTTGIGLQMQDSSGTALVTTLDNGNVGIGTMAPGAKLAIAVANSSAFSPVRVSRSNNTGQTAAIDFYPAGSLSVSNPAWGCGIFPSSPQFAITTNDGASITVKLTVDSNGNVGIGVAQPDVALDVNGSIEYTGTITDVSDARLKENIHPIEGALKKIQAINGVYFNMKETPREREIGVIAQEVRKVLPEAVKVTDEENGYLGVNYSGLIPVLIEAVKTQQIQIEELETRLKKLEQKKSVSALK